MCSSASSLIRITGRSKHLLQLVRVDDVLKKVSQNENPRNIPPVTYGIAISLQALLKRTKRLAKVQQDVG